MAFDAGKDYRDDWETPAWLYDELDAEFGFTLDPCATEANAKCRLFFTERTNGLAQPWSPHTVFMNPPYGREIGEWMRKARREADDGATVVCLVPARLDTAWWHETCHRSEVRFRRGRVNFVGGHAALPACSAVVVMRPTDMKRQPKPVGGWLKMSPWAVIRGA